MFDQNGLCSYYISVCLTAQQNLNLITKKEVLKNPELYHMMRYMYWYIAAHTRDRWQILSITNSPTGWPRCGSMECFVDWLNDCLTVILYIYISCRKEPLMYLPRLQLYLLTTAVYSFHQHLCHCCHQHPQLQVCCYY